MNDFEKYQSAKQQFNISYKGYALNRVLALGLWQLSIGKYPFKLKYLAKIFLAYDFKDLFFDPEKHKILATFGMYKRKDHKATYDNVISMLGQSVSSNILITPHRSVCFNLKAISFVLCKILPIICKKGNKGMNNKLSFIIEMIFWCNTIDKLIAKNYNEVCKYLCFCDALDFENLLTQHFKLLGIPTYSLSHGTHHIIYKTPEPGMLGYENMETDHLLLWGQYSVDEYAKYGINKNRLYLAGYPKPYKLTNVTTKKDNKRCIVLLSQHYFYDLNMRLLEILTGYTSQYEFTIKPHPAAVEYYKDYAVTHKMKIINSNETIDSCLNQERYDWCIAVNTGAYYEALMRGVRCLRYSDGSFDLQPGCNDIFENKDQFEMKINEILNMPVNEYQMEVNKSLTYAYGFGINNYRDIIVNH